MNQTPIPTPEKTVVITSLLCGCRKQLLGTCKLGEGQAKYTHKLCQECNTVDLRHLPPCLSCLLLLAHPPLGCCVSQLAWPRRRARERESLSWIIEKLRKQKLSWEGDRMRVMTSETCGEIGNWKWESYRSLVVSQFFMKMGNSTSHWIAWLHRKWKAEGDDGCKTEKLDD